MLPPLAPDQADRDRATGKQPLHRALKLFRSVPLRLTLAREDLGRVVIGRLAVVHISPLRPHLIEEVEEHVFTSPSLDRAEDTAARVDLRHEELVLPLKRDGRSGTAGG